MATPAERDDASARDDADGRTAKTMRIVLHIAGICLRLALTAIELYCCYSHLSGH